MNTRIGLSRRDMIHSAAAGGLMLGAPLQARAANPGKAKAVIQIWMLEPTNLHHRTHKRRRDINYATWNHVFSIMLCVTTAGYRKTCPKNERLREQKGGEGRQFE